MEPDMLTKHLLAISSPCQFLRCRRRPTPRGQSGGIRRRGPRQNFHHGADGKLSIYGGFAVTHERTQGSARYHRLFRNGSAKEKYLPKLRRRVDWRVLSFRAASRFRTRRIRIDARRINKEGTHYVLTGRRCGSQRRLRRCLPSFSRRLTARNSPPSSSSAPSRIQARQRRAQNGHPRAASTTRFPGKLQVAERKPAHEIGRGTSWP